jgi:hypothetical protein
MMTMPGSGLIAHGSIRFVFMSNVKYSQTILIKMRFPEIVHTQTRRWNQSKASKTN